jgi:MerR family copper efflux transcriptional regulator
MQIGELANAVGLSRDALRFYEKRGLIASIRRDNGYREYPPEAVDWLRYVRTAQSLGFTLAEIEADLPLLAAPGTSAPLLREALQKKIRSIDERIEGLSALRQEISRRLEEGMATCPLAPGEAFAKASGLPVQYGALITT